MKAVTDKTKAGWAIRPRFQRSFHLLPFCYDRKTPRFSKRSKTHHRRTNTVVETKDDVLEVSLSQNAILGSQSLQKIASFRMPDRDIEVDVQTNIWCPWFELELIGTLTGKDADVASRLAIYQVERGNRRSVWKELGILFVSRSASICNRGSIENGRSVSDFGRQD